LQNSKAEIEATGLQLVGISYDSVEVLARFAQRREVGFPLLSDPGSAMIKAYKILNEQAGGRVAGIPHPMTFVVGKDGVIKAKLGRERYQVRHEVTELVAAAKKLNEETTEP
jgi:peroxiredoxin Q/BCP